ncbi:rapamycin-insensitive companion of mTOR [Patella vulgata]|uniref:rapamycin-insensitive companion of mTOR n=1 Tax=Patella vulgata TaxID=6465 RepID=UPI00217F4095|nr:rapamycin-insensitive companion of mTOR [Patella vulgata]
MASRRFLKSSRFRARRESVEEVIKFDPTKDTKESVHTVLKHLVDDSGTTTSKKLAYLNFFVKLLRKLDGKAVLGLSENDILCCLRLGLFHEAKEVRAATLRVLRHLIDRPNYVDSLLYLQLDLLIARCIDICLENEIERIQALKLIRKLGQTAANKIPSTLLHPVIAVGNDGATEWDRMLRVCLATLCEMAFQNIDTLFRCGGISTILRSILDCHLYPRLNESLTCTILYLLNHPKTRHYIKPNTDLEQLLAPFTDCHFKYNGETERPKVDDKENRFIASKMALITVMRSWPGLIRLCHPEGSGLQSFIGILYLPYIDIRKSALEMIFDLFQLKLPTWTEDFSLALSGVDPSEMNENWKLGEGFVAEEGRTILPHVATTRPNLVENHTALILCAWINAGILEALVEVITSSEGALFCRAVILLGELLHLANTLLPPDCATYSHCLPTLIAMASSFDIPLPKRHQASLTVSYLDEFHILKKRGAIPCSLFLDQLLQHAGKFMEYAGKHWHLRRDKLSEFYFKKIPSEDLVFQAIKDTQILVTKSYQSWDLDLISALLKLPDEKLMRLDDQLYIRFIRQLTVFFKPSSNLFCRIELTSEHCHKICEVGCHLIDFLLKSNQVEAQKQIDEWLTDIAQAIDDVTSPYQDKTAALGVASLHQTLGQYYFVFIGKFTATQRGERYLDSSGLYQKLLELISSTSQDVYIKVTISSLNYVRNGTSRVLLSKALTGSNEVARLYATKFLRVLLRTGINGFEVWGLQLLVTQLYDTSQAVAMSALNILDEACDIQVNLQSLVNLRPSFLHLGHKGNMMLCKLLSTERGFKSLMEANFVSNELDKWEKMYNRKYADFVEEQLNEALTTYEKTYHGSFTRRSILKRPKKEVFLPSHIYGQLVQHKHGFKILQKQDCIKQYFNYIQSSDLLTDKDIMNLKTALWAVGNIGTSSYGVAWLDEESVIPEIIKLAEESGVFSIRGTAFYVLGLVASTRTGVNILSKFGWESLCHSREDQWPVYIESDSMISNMDSESHLLSNGQLKDMSSNASDGHHLSYIMEESRGDMTNEQSLPLPGLVPRSNTLPMESSTFIKYKSSKAMSEPISSGFRLRTFSAEKINFFTRGNPEMVKILKGETADNESNLSISLSPTSHISTFSDHSVNDLKSGELSSPEDIITKGMGMFKIGSDSILKHEKINGNGSLKSKSRTSSLNTDSTTSGVGSCESGSFTNPGASSLSPKSDTSVPELIMPTDLKPEATAPATKEPVHPSLVQRRLAKLNRIPSLHRRSASPALALYQSTSPDAPTAPYTSYQDAVGYATFRTIKRTRTYSGDEYDPIHASWHLNPRLDRTHSTESDVSVEGNTFSSFGIKRNVSSASLPDYDSLYNHLNNSINKSSLSASSSDRFVGLSLPVDISMVFEVIEGEDSRSYSSTFNTTPDVNQPLFLSGLKIAVPEYVPPLSKDINLEHETSTCLACVRLHCSSKPSSQKAFRDMPSLETDDENIGFDKTVRTIKTERPRGDSLLEASSVTPGSLTSTTDSDAGSKKICEDDAHGKIIVRKEVLRLLISLSSSIGMKSSEQGLLVLKQKFPKTFQDLCFYSEVGHILATYSFRLGARRFTQELFEELDITSLQEDAKQMLGITKSTETSFMNSIPQDSLEGLTEI